MKKIYFYRAIFISWYCSKGDCKFCYMSTQKNKIKNPRLARRTKESILTEVLLCKLFNWKIEFLSGGYESYTFEEFLQLVKEVKQVYGKKVWLNVGTLGEKELIKLKPYVEGIAGAVECINKKLRNYLCPSKPLEDIEKMLENCRKISLKRGITIILGLGESIYDFEKLKEFIKKYNLEQITFYRLKPQKDTIFQTVKPIDKEYYAEWIRKTRECFPKIKIITGSWITHLDEISLLLKAGSDGITKFTAVKKFNSEFAKKIEEEVKKAGMEFNSNLTKMPKIDIRKELDKTRLEQKLKDKIAIKLEDYLKTMQKNS